MGTHIIFPVVYGDRAMLRAHARMTEILEERGHQEFCNAVHEIYGLPMRDYSH